MIYFDNAATGGRKPDAVLNALSSAVKVCANPGRSGHKLSLACANQVQDCRNELNEYFNGYGYDRVIFTKNCTEALNIALFGCLKRGDHVIASCMEHNSVLRPLEFLKQSGLITYDVCPLTEANEHGTICLRSLKKLIKPNTRLVAVTTASNVNGQIPHLKEIKKILSKNVLLLCDGAQGGGHFSIDMQALGIDFLTLAGHKGMLGIQGSGGLLFSERAELSPLLYGGTGSISLSLDMPDFYPDALEAGTLAFPAIVSMLEGVRYLNAHGEELKHTLHSLTEYCIDGIQNLHGYTLHSTVNPCGIVAFSSKKLQSEHLASILSSKYSIAVRGGLHCAPLMHEALGTLDGGLVRASFSHFNSKREIDVFLAALQAIERE